MKALVIASVLLLAACNPSDDCRPDFSFSFFTGLNLDGVACSGQYEDENTTATGSVYVDLTR